MFPIIVALKLAKMEWQSSSLPEVFLSWQTGRKLLSYKKFVLETVDLNQLCI